MNYLQNVLVKIAFVVLFIITPKPVGADGVVMINSFNEKWDFASESNQQAVITYQNGVEKLAIGITAEKITNDALWIFPVPADPEKVAIEILDKFPNITGGREIKQLAALNIDDQQKFLLSTQIYPLPFVFNSQFIYRRYLREISNTIGDIGENLENLENSIKDVKVFEHLEKNGVTAELVTAKNIQALGDYLQKKGVNIQPTAIPSLAYYNGKNYSFVISWLTPSQNFKNRESIINTIATVYLHLDRKDPSIDWSKLEKLTDDDLLGLIGELAPLQNSNPSRLREIAESMKFGAPSLFGARGGKTIRTEDLAKNVALLVSFPTKHPFFPLRPTSIYGSTIVPLTIRVSGLVKPNIPNEIKTYSTVEYYIKEDYPKPLFPKKPEFYTKFELAAPSKFLIDDLWFNARAPFNIALAKTISTHPILATIILLIIISVVSGALAGFGVFREWRTKEGIRKFALIGFWNSFSIFGMLIALSFARTKKMEEDALLLANQLQSKGYDTRAIQRQDIRKLWFALIFSAIFVVLSLIITELLKLIMKS